jgi:integrase
MAGRPQLPVGAYGSIRTRDVTPPGKPTVWEALARVRDADGVTRRVKARGRSRTAAETALKRVLVGRTHVEGDFTGDSRVQSAGALWLEQRREQAAAGDIAPRTLEKYESVWRLHVAPGLGELRLREASVARCEAWQRELRRRVSPEECRKARAVLSQVLGYAVRMGAIPTNPVRDLSPIPGGRKRQPRAMTAAERAAWLSWLDTHVADDPRRPRKVADRTAGQTAELIASRALGDITRVMLATGARVGEVMALGWDDVDLEAGTVHLRHHLVRVKGEGLRRAPGTKRGDGRMLRLPSWATDVLLRRRVAAEGETPVFPDDLGGWRDPNLVMRWIRWSRDQAGFGWLTSHVFRQTVITILDEAGLSTRTVADQVGHSQISQTQSYMARRVASDAAAAALEDLL